MKRTGILWDEVYLGHLRGVAHPERPERLQAIQEIVDELGDYVKIDPRMATDDEILTVHTPGHLNSIKQIKEQGTGYFDGDTPFTIGSYNAAFKAAGGVLELTEQIHDGKLENGFAFVRPPGHHAEANHPMGFCLFNNIAIAAEYLVRQKSLSRVAIIDIDVHHGNGTQHSFYKRADVFYISTHHYPFYPGTGSAGEKGEGAGLGYTLNVPLAGGADDDAYFKSYDNLILPALQDYKPEFMLISAGFDAHYRDPLGGHKMTKDGFKKVAQHLNEVAKKYSAGKILYVLEGGYDLKGLQEGVGAVLDQL
ncbi:histone deacetylase [bacterium]|nr:histone deacetylase [bacterium]